MSTLRQTTFADLLRRYRKAAGLTQEELAAAAGLSERAISDLERGLRTSPHRDTIQMLADALQLTEPQRAELSVSARRGAQSAPPPASTAHLGVDHPMLAPVGRQRELAQIERLLSNEGPPVLLLSGEPGIGKTRLLQEASQRAARSGWTVLEGGCQRRSGQMPFSPVSEAVERYLRALPAAQRRERLRGCDWLVRLLPELEAWGLRASTDWTLAPEQEQRLLFAALGRLLENSAGPAGALLVLDDLQWAGSDTLSLLATLIQSSASTATLRLIGAYRSTEVQPHDALGMLVADFLRQGLLDRAELAPLAEGDAAIFLERLIGSSADDALTADIIRRTGGVPYFLTSYAASLRGATDCPAQEESDAPLMGDAAGVPWTITESIRQRVAALPRAGQSLLGVVAIAGRFIDRELLFATAQRFAYAATDTLEGVEAACRGRLLSERGPDGYQFAHDLIRETILGDLSAARKALLHQQIGEELEKRSTRRRDVAAELAWHFGASGDGERALTYALEAGDLAAAVYAHAEAERRYHDALVLARRLADAKREAESLEKLGGALCMLGRYDEALDTLRLAMRAHRNVADSEGQARTAVLAADMLGNRAASEEGIEWLESVVESPNEARISPRAKAAILASLSSLYMSCARYEEALTAAERALELGRSLGDTHLMGRGYDRVALALNMLGRPVEAHKAGAEAVRLLEETGNAAALSVALGEFAASCIVIGQLDDARRRFERAVEYATQVGEPVQLAWLHIQMSELEFVSGRWDHARAECDAADALLRSLDATWYTAYVNLQVGALDLAQGRRASGLAAIQRAIAYEEPMRDLQILRYAQHWAAESDLAAGDSLSARVRLDPLVADVAQRESDITALLPFLAWACAETGETTRAEELTRLAVERSTRNQLPFVLVDGLRIQALLAMRRGAWQEAAAALDGSLETCRALPCPWAEAKALYVYGLLHTMRGDPVPARQSFVAALAICDRLGEGMYRPLIEAALADLRT